MTFKHTEPSLAITQAGATFRVSFDRRDALQPHRTWWNWSVEDTRSDGFDAHAEPVVLACGSDLSTATRTDLVTALESLLGFLSAWAESENGENATLFPVELREKLSMDSDDFVMLAIALRDESEGDEA